MPTILFYRNKHEETASGDSSPSSSGVPWQDDTGSKSTRAVDRELEELMNSTMTESEEEEDDDDEEEDLELEEKDEKQELSTEASFVKYDELR